MGRTLEEILNDESDFLMGESANLSTKMQNESDPDVEYATKIFLLISTLIQVNTSFKEVLASLDEVGADPTSQDTREEVMDAFKRYRRERDLYEEAKVILGLVSADV